MQGLLVWSPVRELRSHTPQNNSAHEPQLLSPLTTTRIGMSQQKIPWNTTKILHPATKTWCNQVNKYFKKRYHVFPKKSGKPLIDSGVLVKYWVCGWKCVQFEWRFIAQFSSVTQWCLTLWSHKLQHARPPYPSPTPGAFSNSCPSSWWCHPTISSSSGSESALCIRWPKYWSFSFSISPSNEYSGLISFRMDWLDLFAVQGTLKSMFQQHSSKTSILWPSAFFIVQLLHDYWKKHNFD